MSEYPEHEKLKAIQPQSQAFGELIVMMREHGWIISEPHPYANELVPVKGSIEDKLAVLFDIDLEKIDAEKNLMLTKQRLLNIILG